MENEGQGHPGKAGRQIIGSRQTVWPFVGRTMRAKEGQDNPAGLNQLRTDTRV